MIVIGDVSASPVADTLTGNITTESGQTSLELNGGAPSPRRTSLSVTELGVPLNPAKVTLARGKPNESPVEVDSV